MIHVITGVPGAGKTLRAVKHIVDAQKTGRLIFSNIDGLKIDGVQLAPSDWTTTPEGSLVVYDEAQKIFPPDGKTGRSNRPDIAAMEEHRHTGHDLILITQHPNLLHAHVRRLAGKHEHLNRAFGWNKAQVYLRDQMMRPESRTDLNAAEKTFWDHDKKLFQYYKSSSLHVEHKRLPKPLIYSGISLLMLSALIFYFWGKTSLFNPSENADRISSSVQTDIPHNDAVRSSSASSGLGTHIYTGVEPPKIAMAGCISTKHFCRCFTHDYQPIFMEQAACRIQMEMPIPRSLNVDDQNTHEGRKENTGGADEGAPPDTRLPSSGFIPFEVTT